MFSRVAQIYADRQARLNNERRFDNISSIHSASKESIPNEEENERTVVEVANIEPTPDFDTRAIGFFGILHSTVNIRFKRIMLVGIVNVLLVLSFVLFMLFFVLKIKCSKPDIITEFIPCSTSPMPTTTKKAPTTASTGVVFVCPKGFTLVGQTCWQIFSDQLDRAAAKDMCKSKNQSILFGIYSAVQDQEFVNFMTIKDTPCWLGLMCSNGNSGNCSFDNGLHAPFPYTAFAYGSPTTSSDCLFYDISATLGAQWTSASCDRELPFVCELVPKVLTVTCDHLYKNYCYYLHENQLSFSDAQDTCRDQCGNLASIGDEGENTFLAGKFGDDSNLFYLGGMVMADDSIIWTDGTIMGYNKLKNYTAKESCLVMGTTGDWSTTKCGKLFGFVCKVLAGENC